MFGNPGHGAQQALFGRGEVEGATVQPGLVPGLVDEQPPGAVANRSGLGDRAARAMQHGLDAQDDLGGLNGFVT